MTYAHRLAICATASVAAHLMLAHGSARLPARVEAAPAVVVRVELHEPPLPEPEPEQTSPEKVEAPSQPVHEVPTRRVRRTTTETPARPSPTKQATPTERPASRDMGAEPVFGISMESTSSAGSGPSLPVGNTLQTRPRGQPGETDAAAAKALAAPVPAYEVTRMPLPVGDCQGKYTDQAREVGLEGVVVFDLVVDERGRTREITVVQGLGAGLTEAAKRALQSCAFTPGERDGKAVPVRIRSFKIRFRLREGD